MIYIMIVMWAGIMSQDSGKAALAVEFNTLDACQSAQVAIRKQYSTAVTVCAAKGSK